MKKDDFIKANEVINKIEDLFLEADKLFDKIKPEIQEAIGAYHNDRGSMQYCLRWGLQAAEEIRKDWANVVSELQIDELGE